MTTIFMTANSSIKRYALAFILFSLLAVSAHASPVPCIGVITAGGGVGFWRHIQQGALTAAQELNIKVIVRGAVDETDVQGQKHIIDYVVKLGCKTLVIAPNSLDRREDTKHLKQQGIDTLFIDRDVGGDRISVIKTNNYQAGFMAGMEMVKALKPLNKSRIAILRMDKNVSSTSLRESGFIKAVTNNGLKVVLDAYIGTTVSSGRRNATTLLQDMHNIDAIFTPNESTSTSVLVTLKQLNKQDDVIHIGFDSHKFMVQAVSDGKMYGFISQQPFLMGYKAVQTAYQVMQGQAVAPDIHTEVIFVNSDNIMAGEIQQLLGLSE